MRGALFCEVGVGLRFIFYDRPDRIMVKQDWRFYVSPRGVRRISDPHVLVFPLDKIAHDSTCKDGHTN